ncbi:hypothetical protein PROFUN_16107 [Planoprotostelium fungivorum]|uniref:Uncharacterized protein n=1 Tax=Planoprotostelium fungivorum TaxID=1890364 RepID=A0A2P6MRL9_9EUKA|nr:hypothetical protein PROFUN_16107 [Planoprotostelium fungivorum]
MDHFSPDYWNMHDKKISDPNAWTPTRKTKSRVQVHGNNSKDIDFSMRNSYNANLTKKREHGANERRHLQLDTFGRIMVIVLKQRTAVSSKQSGVIVQQDATRQAGDMMLAFYLVTPRPPSTQFHTEDLITLPNIQLLYKTTIMSQKLFIAVYCACLIHSPGRSLSHICCGKQLGDSISSDRSNLALILGVLKQYCSAEESDDPYTMYLWSQIDPIVVDKAKAI